METVTGEGKTLLSKTLLEFSVSVSIFVHSRLNCIEQVVWYSKGWLTYGTYTKNARILILNSLNEITLNDHPLSFLFQKLNGLHY